MEKPIIFVVDNNPQSLNVVVGELDKRYRADYQILGEQTPAAALAKLEELKRAGAEVAILLAGCWLPGMTGADFLQRAHRLYTGAKRGLLLDWGDQSADQLLVDAMSLNRMDAFSAKPIYSPDEEFHQFITSFLNEWARENRPPQFVVFKIVGEQWSRRSHELRDLLTRNGISFEFYDDDSEEGRALLEKNGSAGAPLPVVIQYNGRVLVDPSNTQLAEAVGASTGFETTSRPVVDIVIVGGGPAGLSAAVNGASEGLEVVVVEREAMGGQAGMSSRIRNYLGFPTGIPGGELAARAFQQASLFRAEFIFTHEASGLGALRDLRFVTLSDGSELPTRTVILSMGAAYRRLQIPDLERLVGAGVFYGAVGSEALALKGGEVFVVGGANSAGQAAVYLSRYAARVTLLVMESSLSINMSEYLIREIEAQPNIEVRLNTMVTGGGGEERLEWIVVQEGTSGKIETLPAAALFVMIGAEPHTGWLPDAVKRDRSGYVLTGQDLMEGGNPPPGWPLERLPYPMETSLPGVFAVGDVRRNSVKRVASAVGEGAIAVQYIHQYLRDLQRH